MAIFTKKDLIIGTKIKALTKSALTALLVGTCLLSAAGFFVIARNEYVFHSRLFARLSNMPWNFALNEGNTMQFRLLSPSVAYLLHLRGDLFLWLPLIFAVLFLAFIYAYFRQQQYRLWEAIGMAAMVAFSIPISMTLHWPGITDTTSYFLLFLCLVFIRHSWLWPLLFALALFNHEANLFAAPWLLMWANMREFSFKRLSWTITLIGLALLPMLLFRHYVTTFVDVKYSMDFYLSAKQLRLVFNRIHGKVLMGIFGAWRLFWFWPIYVIYRYIKIPGQRRIAVWLGLVIVCAALQLTIAYDVTRLMGLAFPSILVGAHESRKLWGQTVFRRRFWLLFGFNFLVPKYFVYSYRHIVPLVSMPMDWVQTKLFGLRPWIK